MVTSFTSICLSRFGFRFSNLNENQKTNFKSGFQSSYFENRKTIWFFVLCLNFSINPEIKTSFLILHSSLFKKKHFGYTNCHSIVRKVKK